MSGSHRILRVAGALASASALALTVAAGSATLAVGHLQGNVTTVDISDQVGQRPLDFGDLSQGPVTLLVMGSDERTGTGNTRYGHFDGARSDTTMLVHVYPDRESAVVLSIPRDTVMQLPACRSSSGEHLGAVRDRFNAAFDRGGPGCTVKAVESLTGLQVDHFVVLDFHGFKKTINALGGVEVCLTRPLKDEKSGVDLPAGRTRVKGEDALAFVRVRHNIGDGSDISRINRQQLFLSSLIQEVSSSGLLTDPLRLWRVLNEASKSLAADRAMTDPAGVVALASSLVGIRPKDITFVTLPWLPSGDGATIVMDRARAEPIFAAIAEESPWPPPPTKGADGQPLTVLPARVLVDVRNATGTQGVASTVAGELAGQGFRTGRLDSGPDRATTVIRHSPDQLEAARTLQAAVPGSTLKEVDSLGPRLQLVLGRDAHEVRAIRVRTPSSSSSGSSGSGTSSAAQDICTG